MNKFRTTEGMTLIELVVVLAILGGLASIAVRTASTMNRRGRCDQTSAQMKAIREVIVGDGRDVGRFVRDMGRLPNNLSELWKNDGTCLFGAYPITQPSGWPSGITLQSQTLSFGWNGPYLDISDLSQADLYDGFGNEFVYSDNFLISLGADNQYGGSSWPDRDQTNQLTRLNANLTVNIKTADSNRTWQAACEDLLSSLHVVLFQPDPDAAAVTTNLLAKTVVASCGVTNLAPTVCGVYAYGENTDSDLLSTGDFVDVLELKPGANVITLYLRKQYP